MTFTSENSGRFGVLEERGTFFEGKGSHKQKSLLKAYSK
jgi:hypothetical protein